MTTQTRTQRWTTNILIACLAALALSGTIRALVWMWT